MIRSSGHRSLWNNAAERVFDMDGDDLVGTGLRTQAQAFGLARIEAAGSSLDKTNDGQIELVADPGDGLLAGDPPKRLDLPDDGHRHVRHRQVAPLCDLRRIHARRIDEEIDGGSRRSMGVADVKRDWQDGFLTVQRLADDAGEKTDAALLGLPGRTQIVGSPMPTPPKNSRRV